MSRACEEEGMMEEGEEECEEEEDDEIGDEECEEEGMVEEGEEVEAQDPRGERRSAGIPNLTKDQKIFLIMQKSVNATYKEIVKRWTDRFSRKPPSRSSVKRNLKRAREENTIKTKNHNSGQRKLSRPRQ